MVCNRCKTAVAAVFKNAGLLPSNVELGAVELPESISKETKEAIAHSLSDVGFELIDDKRSLLIEQIKNTVVELVHHSDEAPSLNLSQVLTQKLHYDYNYLSHLFSEVEGTSIEKFYIAHRIEKVKELLMYDQLTLSQIADKLGYSSVAYLSNQFKKETGLSPSFYKSLKQSNRKNLDEL